MGLTDLFSSAKKPRYPRERQLPADVLPVSNHTADSICLGGSQGVDLFSGFKSASGYPVNETTAMRVAAVYACVEKICVIASLPKHIYERQGGGSEKVDNHDYAPLLNLEPNAGTWTAQSLWERIIQSFLLRGDGLCRIIRRGDRTGKIIGIKPYLREHVTIKIGLNGEIGYIFHEPYTSENITATAKDVLHFPGFSFNGYRGLSVIQSAAQSGIGIALSADQYSAEFFANSARPDYLLSTEGKLSADQGEVIRKQLEERIGGIGNRHKPLVLQGGLKFEQISLTSQDAQLLETRQWEASNICTAFGVPPQLIGVPESTAGWAGASIEQLNIGFARYTLKDHISRMEQEITRKLFGAGGKYFVKFHLDYFLEGDSKAQAEFLGKALGGPGQQGYMTVQEARKLKGLPPLDDPKYDQVIESGSKPQGNAHAPEPA